jgi:hypothetical protein
MRVAVAFIVAVITALVPAVVLPAPAAAVRADSNGQPCFTVDAAAEQRDGMAQFLSVTVTDVARAGAAWEMALPSGRSFALTHTICIPYAGRVTALPQTPAAALAPGRVYRVTLAVRNWDRPKAPRAYTAHFCLVGPGRAVRQVEERAGCPGGPEKPEGEEAIR